MKNLWWLILLLYGHLSFSADDITLGPQKYLVINPVNSQIPLTDMEKRMIDKVILKSCAKQADYQIAIGDIGIARDAFLNIYNLNLTLTGKDSALVVSAILLDEKNKIVITKVVKENVVRLHLMRNIEEVMETIFPKPVKPAKPKRPINPLKP